MAEIKQPPTRIIIDGTIYDAFGVHHTLSDIARWLMSNRVDAEEVYQMLHKGLGKDKDKVNPDEDEGDDHHPTHEELTNAYIRWLIADCNPDILTDEALKRRRKYFILKEKFDERRK